MIIHLIGLIGLGVYGLASGRFSPEKRQQYLATWKGEKLVPYVEEVVEEEVEESPRDASARIIEQQLNQEIVSRELQLQLDLLKNMKETLDEAQSKLQKDKNQFVDKKDEFEDKVKESQDKAREEGFKKALETFSTLNPKYVKDDFMVMDEKDVVRFLTAMKPGVRTEVLSKFREPDEQLKRVKLIELLKENGVVDVE